MWTKEHLSVLKIIIYGIGSIYGCCSHCHCLTTRDKYKSSIVSICLSGGFYYVHFRPCFCLIECKMFSQNLLLMVSMERCTQFQQLTEKHAEIKQAVYKNHCIHITVSIVFFFFFFLEPGTNNKQNLNSKGSLKLFSINQRDIKST